MQRVLWGPNGDCPGTMRTTQEDAAFACCAPASWSVDAQSQSTWGSHQGHNLWWLLPKVLDHLFILHVRVERVQRGPNGGHEDPVLRIVVFHPGRHHLAVFPHHRRASTLQGSHWSCLFHVRGRRSSRRLAEASGRGFSNSVLIAY